MNLVLLYALLAIGQIRGLEYGSRGAFERFERNRLEGQLDAQLESAAIKVIPVSSSPVTDADLIEINEFISKGDRLYFMEGLVKNKTGRMYDPHHCKVVRVIDSTSAIVTYKTVIRFALQGIDASRFSDDLPIKVGFSLRIIGTRKNGSATLPVFEPFALDNDGLSSKFSEQGKWVPGTWSINYYPNKDNHTFVVHDDGTIEWDGTKTAQLKPLGDLVIFESGGRVERWRFANGQLSAQHYLSQADLENNIISQYGNGQRVITKQASGYGAWVYFLAFAVLIGGVIRYKSQIKSYGPHIRSYGYRAFGKLQTALTLAMAKRNDR